MCVCVCVCVCVFVTSRRILKTSAPISARPNLNKLNCGNGRGPLPSINSYRQIRVQTLKNHAEMRIVQRSEECETKSATRQSHRAAYSGDYIRKPRNEKRQRADRQSLQNPVPLGQTMVAHLQEAILNEALTHKLCFVFYISHHSYSF